MSDARTALKALARQAMLERGFDPDYPPDAIAQAAAPSPAADHSRRLDLRDRLWASIDNDDSRDLDQLSTAEARGDAIGVLVAIADVDTLVPRGSAADRHAAINTTSVYTVAEVFAMLPEQLSTDRTSLGAGVERPAIVVDMTVESNGELSASDVFLATVRNRAKLAYGSVGAWLEGREAAPRAVQAVDGLAENLRLQAEAAARLETSRHRHGALTLDTVETRPVLTGSDVSDVTGVPRSPASALIEDLMIAANTSVAKFLERHGLASVRRVVKTPERWPRIQALAAETGTTLPDAPDHQALERWLLQRRAHDPAQFQDLSLAVVKLLGRGEYVVEPPNDPVPDHFGLAVDDYAHSTAPNRRFADLVTQRLVKSVLTGGGAPYTEDELVAIAAHCTEREDAANRVERQVRKAAAAMLLSRRRGEVFDAIVTGASKKGTWVRIRHPLAEGRLMRDEQGLEVGQRLRVRLLNTDPGKGFIDFAPV